MAQVCFRIPDEKRTELEKIAVADRRSLSFVINDAIDFYLKCMAEPVNANAEDDTNVDAAE